MKKIVIIIFGILFSLFSVGENRWKYKDGFSYRLKESLDFSYQFLYGIKDVYKHNLTFGYYIFDRQSLELEIGEEMRLNSYVNFLNVNIAYAYNILGTKRPSNLVYWEIIPVIGISQNYLIKDKTNVLDKTFFLGFNYGIRAEFVFNSFLSIPLAVRFENVLNNQSEFGVFRNYLGGGIKVYF